MGALTQLFGGLTQVWLNVAFIVCVFAALLFKPERIRNPSLFFSACVLFALSLIVPSLGLLLLDSASDPTHFDGGSPFGELTMTMRLVNILPPILFAGAFLSAVSSVAVPPNNTE
jgi:hypothetical protein